MLVVQNGYECDYELKIFANLFFNRDEDVDIFLNFEYKNKNINVYTQINYKGNVFFDDYYFPFDAENKRPQLIKKIFTASCAKSFVHAARKIKNINLPWGVMCGIRPAKNIRELIDYGYSDEEIENIIKIIYEVEEDKIKLAHTVAKNEEKLLKEIGKNSVSIYIGIPFCPTRCLYCSFVSTDIRTSGKYMEEFTDKLLLEIDKTAEIINKIGCYVENIYIGGGTPTTLSENQLEKIYKRLHKYFDFSKIKEFTLEAGRPDTITDKKLRVSKNYGVDRISINPQTMNDITLKKIGRLHSSKMITDKYYEAKKFNFKSINMDLIAGLPGETPDMFKFSLDKVLELDPENITVHSMCIKHSADLRQTDIKLTEAENMNMMLAYAQEQMKKTGREPYYMYRQKNSSGNLENVGYAKKGKMSTYNVNIMEEKQTIIALGGGGSTKLVMEDRIERIFNFKDPYEYIRRFDEILDKKDEILSILSER